MAVVGLDYNMHISASIKSAPHTNHQWSVSESGAGISLAHDGINQYLRLQLLGNRCTGIH